MPEISATQVPLKIRRRSTLIVTSFVSLKCHCTKILDFRVFTCKYNVWLRMAYNSHKTTPHKMAKCHEHFLKMSAKNLAYIYQAILRKCRRYQKRPVLTDLFSYLSTYVLTYGQLKSTLKSTVVGPRPPTWIYEHCVGTSKPIYSMLNSARQ